MSGASVIFYGRRSRSIRSFDDLGFRGSSSSSSSSSSSDRGSQHHRHRKTDLHRRCRRNHDLGEFPRSSLARSPVVASDPQQGCVFDFPSRNIISGETSLSGGLNGNGRLPVPVLLAKERLLQRLRGVTVSGSSSSGETEPSSSGNDFREVYAVFETSDSREQPPLYNFSELPSGVPYQSAPRKPNKKLPGLSEETLSQLHHEIYMEEQQKGIGSSASHDCSICLENFVQGNELVNLGCGHRFHTVCLYPWLQTCGECPNCRSCFLSSSFLK